MPRSRRIPKYRHYQPKNLGVVRLDGKDHYLGRHDTAESWEWYHRLIADHLAARGQPLRHQPAPTDGSIEDRTVDQLLLSYWQFAEGYYVRDGEPTKELAGMRDALRPVRKLYGNTRAAQFGPLKLKMIRDQMTDHQDLCRNEINKRIGRIKRVFRWAVSEELVSPTVIHGLDSVKGLRKGRSRARESKKVRPVADQHVDAVLPCGTGRSGG